MWFFLALVATLIDPKCPPPLHVILRHDIFFEAGLAQAGPAMKLPVMPGANDVFAVEASFSQRPAGVVTHC